MERRSGYGVAQPGKSWSSSARAYGRGEPCRTARGVRRQPQMLSEAPIRRSFGGAAIAFIGVILETIISALIAPAMMLIQSQAIAAIMMGRDVGWQVQRRNDGSLSWPESARRYAGHTVFGFILGASAYAVSLPLFLWMTPVVVGLLLTIPLAVLTSYSRLGARPDRGRDRAFVGA
jgi:membrane glycosyltransferase